MFHFRNRNGILSRTLIFSLISVSFMIFHVQCQECIDRPHFNYNCWQLSMYCKSPQAERVRTSCPVTCGTCGQVARSSSVDGLSETMGQSHISEVERPHQQQGGSEQRIEYQGQPPTSHPVAEGHNMQNRPPVHNLESPPGAFKGSVQPVRSEAIPTSHFQAVTDSEAQQKLRSCCSSKGLTKACISICTYSTTKADVLAKAIAGSCTLDDARIWVQCASGGRQNSPCCRNYGIYGCDDICNGQISSDFSQLLTCVDNYLEKILKCHRDGLGKSERR